MQPPLEEALLRRGEAHRLVRLRAGARARREARAVARDARAGLRVVEQRAVGALPMFTPSEHCPLVQRTCGISPRGQ